MKRAAICGLILGTLALPALAAISFDEERQVALWILRRGGQVMVGWGSGPHRRSVQSARSRLPYCGGGSSRHGHRAQAAHRNPKARACERVVMCRRACGSPVSDVKAPFSDESFQYYRA